MIPRTGRPWTITLSICWAKKKITHFEYLLPDEYRLDLQLREMAESLPVPVAAIDTQHFLTERKELGDFFAGKKRYLRNPKVVDSGSEDRKYPI
jgi:deoxyribodipyrimidine photolyase-related protein